MTQETINEVLKFRDDRDWKQFHNPKEMADACGLDLDEIVSEKVKRNSEKYPVEKAFGKKEKYTEL